MMKKEGGGYDDTYTVVQSTIEGGIKYQKINYENETIEIPILITREIKEDKEFALKKDKINTYKDDGFSVDCFTFIAFLKDENQDDMLLSIVLAKPVEKNTDDYILHMREDINDVKSNNYYHISLIFWSEINIKNPSKYKTCYCNHDNYNNYTEYYIEHDYGSKYLNLYIIKIYKKYNNKKNNIKFSRIDSSIAVLDHTEGLGNDHMIHDIHLHSKSYHNRELHVSL